MFVPLYVEEIEINNNIKNNLTIIFKQLVTSIPCKRPYKVILVESPQEKHAFI